MSTFQMAALIKVTFQGVVGGSSPVNISVPGIKAGDVVLSISHAGEWGPAASTEKFPDQPIQSDDYIRQFWSGDISSNTFTAVLLRFS